MRQRQSPLHPFFMADITFTGPQNQVRCALTLSVSQPSEGKWGPCGGWPDLVVASAVGL